MSQLKIKDNNNQWVNIPAGGVGVPSGGTAGQILQKSSSTDYATEWVTPKTWTLVWTNPSPNSDFTSQTLNIDGVGNYEEYAVIYKATPSASLENTTYFLKPQSRFMLFGFVLNPIRRPDCEITTNTFTFGQGAIMTTLGQWDSGSNYYIPIRIYAH